MKHKDRVKKQQVEKKLNALTPTKKNNSEIMINDLDTQIGIVEKLRNDPKVSKPGNNSDSIFPSSPDVRKHSVDKNCESSNTDCEKGNIKDSNVPTANTESDDIVNAKKVAALVRKVLNNEIPDENMEWPICLLIESNRSVEISQQEFLNMVTDKTAEILATKSRFAKEMVNLSVCEEEQRLYYKKYKQLLKQVNTLNAQLELLTKEPDTTIRYVRNVGTNVNFPEDNNDQY